MQTFLRRQASFAALDTGLCIVYNKHTLIEVKQL